MVACFGIRLITMRWGKHRIVGLHYDARQKRLLLERGPCNEHNYSTGLWLYHLLTGSRVARDAVIGLAEWVIAMDDGNQHVLGIASSQPTGDASRTNEAEYHGAGRGAGNSINSLLNGWLLTSRNGTW